MVEDSNNSPTLSQNERTISPWLAALFAPIFCILIGLHPIELFSAPIPNDNQLVARMEKGECEGFCPAYKVSIYQDGTVVFLPGSTVGASSQRSDRINSEGMQELLSSIEKLNVQSVKFDTSKPNFKSFFGPNSRIIFRTSDGLRVFDSDWYHNENYLKQTSNLPKLPFTIQTPSGYSSECSSHYYKLRYTGC